jgi:hypothetical protein
MNLSSPAKPSCAPRNFAQRYCRRHTLDSAGFGEAVLARTLYPHARLLRPLIELFRPGFFAVDRDFVDDCGQLLHRGEFGFLAAEFHRHAANLGWLRHTLRLRLSMARMRALWRELEPRHRSAAAGGE